jgi:hypothetical protein
MERQRLLPYIAAPLLDGLMDFVIPAGGTMPVIPRLDAQ